MIHQYIFLLCLYKYYFFFSGIHSTTLLSYIHLFLFLINIVFHVIDSTLVPAVCMFFFCKHCDIFSNLLYLFKFRTLLLSTLYVQHDSKISLKIKFTLILFQQTSDTKENYFADWYGSNYSKIYISNECIYTWENSLLSSKMYSESFNRRSIFFWNWILDTFGFPSSLILYMVSSCLLQTCEIPFFRCPWSQMLFFLFFRNSNFLRQFFVWCLIWAAFSFLFFISKLLLYFILIQEHFSYLHIPIIVGALMIAFYQESFF